MAAGTKPSVDSGSFKGAQEALHDLLLQFPATVDPGEDLTALVSRFCRAVRQMFGASGAYCWLLEDGDNLTGFASDGHQAATFPGVRLSLDQPSLARQAMESGRAAFVNAVDQDPTPAAPTAILAVPLLAMSRPTGVLILTHHQKGSDFDLDTASAVLVLAAHLGGVISNARLAYALASERRRNEAFIAAVGSFNARLGIAAVKQAIADRTRQLFQADVALILWAHLEGFSLDAISADPVPQNPAISSFLSELASRAVIAVDPLFGRAPDDEILLRGEIIAAPLRTHAARGALIISAGSRHFGTQEEVLLSGLATLGSTALSNAELEVTTQTQSQDLQRLLDISASLARGDTIDRFLEQFVLRTAEFLEFERAVVVLLQKGEPFARWLAEDGQATQLNEFLPSPLIRHVLASEDVFATNDITTNPLADPGTVSRHHLKQMISAPLRTAAGRTLGALSAMDRKDGRPVSDSDIRRLKALAAEAAVVIEASENFERLEQHRRRSEDLVSLSLALNSTLEAQDLASAFTAKAAEMLNAPAAASVIVSATGFDAIVLHPESRSDDKVLAHRLAHGLADVVNAHGRAAIHGSAAELLGDNLGQALGWTDVAIAPLVSSSGELIGMLCLANRGHGLDDSEAHLLRAVVAHASVAFENSRLFRQIAHANRSWCQIFDAISDMMIVHDDHNHILRTNRAVADFVGVEPSQIVGMDVRALVPLCSSDSSPCPFCALSNQGISEYDNTEMMRSYLVSTSRMSDNADPQTVHVLKDITDRREVELRYRELFDNIHEGLFFSTPEGRFVEVNDALVKMLGYDSREELLQVDIGTQLHLTSTHRERFLHLLESQGAMRSFECPLLRKDGGIIYTLQNCYAVRDASGRSLQYRGLILDISDVKNFQTELQRQRDFNLKILNNTQSVIIVCDTVGLITYANERCRVACDYDPQTIVGVSLADMVAPETRELFAAAIAATGEGAQLESLELPLRCADGRTVRYSVTLSPMRDEQGNVTSIIALMTDITDASMLQAKLIHSEKMAAVGQLVSGVAHEVNNPLTAIMGYADLLTSSDELPAQARRDLSIILQEAQRTKQIVQNLLSFARQSAPHREPVDLNAVLARTLQLRQYDFVNHGVKVEESFDPNLPLVFGDPQQLQQVFLNVVNNAYDAVRETSRGPFVRIATTARDGVVEVEITDNGSGISAPDRIFDPFFTTKEVGKGTGLGLSICYGIVREHNGEITCANRGDGEGATFLIRLPIHTAAIASAPEKVTA
ncbi:MAG TPA: PAS domain S-box protein [Candidatus Koribacter sp.]|jgi:two-component system NtrC family sensor kinase